MKFLDFCQKALFLSIAVPCSIIGFISYAVCRGIIVGWEEMQ